MSVLIRFHSPEAHDLAELLATMLREYAGTVDVEDGAVASHTGNRLVIDLWPDRLVVNLPGSPREFKVPAADRPEGAMLGGSQDHEMEELMRAANILVTRLARIVGSEPSSNTVDGSTEVASRQPTSNAEHTDSAPVVIGQAESREPVEFTATTPAEMARGSQDVVSVWLHTLSQRQEMMERARAASSDPVLIQSAAAGELAVGAYLCVTLSSTDVQVAESVAYMTWRGNIECATFVVSVPSSCPARAVLTVNCSVNGLEIGRIHVKIRVCESAPVASNQPIETAHNKINKAFVSHASQDKEAVITRIQGMLIAAPWLDVFFSGESIRPRERWEERLSHEIDVSDVLYLFWSRAASTSDWVDREWRWALERKGLDFICPVPLESPADVPPPGDLKALHFDDRWLAQLHYARAHPG